MSMEGGVKLPLDWHTNGMVKLQLRAESAKVGSGGDITAFSPKLELYSESGGLEAVVNAESCRCSREKKVVTSESDVKFEKKGVVITGTGLEWNADSQLIKVLNNVKVVLSGGLGAGGRKAVDGTRRVQSAGSHGSEATPAKRGAMKSE